MNTKDQISEFLQPDHIWETFGAKTQEVFFDKFITKGKFHENVPESIRKDYKTVERLQFYSYYDYPLIDEAFGKSTRIFEASVDLKISKLEIEKKRFESLDSKIKRLEKYSSNQLHEEWIHAKKLRNIFAHHKAGRLMGIILLNAFKHNINMINSIFLEHQEIIEKEDSLKRIAKKSEHLKKGLFIMEYGGKRFLVWSLIPYASSISNGFDKSFWVFHPVYGIKSIKDVSNFPNPFMFNLKDIDIKDNRFLAKIIETNEEIKITTTTNEADKQSYKKHLLQMIDIDFNVKLNYSTVLKNDINKAVTEFIYYNYWE